VANKDLTDGSKLERLAQPATAGSASIAVGSRKNATYVTKSIQYIYNRIRGRRTYTAGIVNSVPLLKVRRKSDYFPSHFSDDPMSPKCSKLHRFAPIFSNISRGQHPWTPKSLEGLSPFHRLLHLDELPTSHVYRASAAAEQNTSSARCSQVLHEDVGDYSVTTTAMLLSATTTQTTITV